MEAQRPQAVVKEGFVVYAFDYCGGGRNSNSDGDYMNMSIMTEKSDLNAVMDFVKGQPFIDNDNLFLFGQSQGGMVSALTAAERPDDVKAMNTAYAEANSELLLLTGKSVHGFEMVYDEGRETALQAGKEFLVKHLGDAEEE